MPDKNIYRQQALDKLAMPEMLDKSLPVTKPLYWIAVIGASILLIALLIWGFFGNINVTIDVSGTCFTPSYANEYVCNDTGIVTSVYKTTGKFVKAGQPIYEYRDSVNSQEVKYWNSPVTGLITTLNVYPGAEIYPGKNSIIIKAFVNETSKSSEVVDVSENHDVNDSYANYNKKVYVFVPMENFGQLTPGLEAEVWPYSADKYSHGHMIGKVDFVNAFVASDDDLKSIVGLDVDISQLKEKGTIGICEIELQTDENTASGFYWTSPNGASQTLYEGDLVNASIIMGRVHPISLLFPGL